MNLLEQLIVACLCACVVLVPLGYMSDLMTQVDDAVALSQDYERRLNEALQLTTGDISTLPEACVAGTAAP